MLSLVLHVWLLFTYPLVTRRYQRVMIIVCLVCNALHLLDWAVKFYIQCKQVNFCRLSIVLLQISEIFSVFLAVGVLSYLLWVPPLSSAEGLLGELLDYTLLLRISRLFLDSVAMHYINDLMFSFRQFWPFFQNLFAVLFIFCYVYGLAGQHLLGFITNPSSGTSSSSSGYSNFNDMSMSFLLLMRFILKWWGPEVQMYQ